MFINYLCR